MANSYYFFLSFQHKKHTNINKDRFRLLNNATERMNHDGINQTRYQVISKVVTEIFTKISVNLLYQDYVNKDVSKSFIVSIVNINI